MSLFTRKPSILSVRNQRDARFRDLTVTGRLQLGADAAPFALLQVAERSFTETGAGTYTASVALPAGATLHDILINGVALWDAATSATLKVGDATDDAGYYTGVNLKATDLLAGESLSFALAGGKAGAYIANSQVSPRYAAAARSIIGVITSVGSGSAGRTRMQVLYALAPALAAVKS